MGKQFDYVFRARVGDMEKLIRAKTFEDALEAVWKWFDDPQELARLGPEIILVDMRMRQERRYPTATKVK